MPGTRVARGPREQVLPIAAVIGLEDDRGGRRPEVVGDGGDVGVATKADLPEARPAAQGDSPTRSLCQAPGHALLACFQLPSYLGVQSTLLMAVIVWAAACGMQTPGGRLTIRSTVMLPSIVGRGALDLEALDDWLETTLEMRLEPAPEPAPDADEHSAAAALVWRALLVAREFLQAARVPAFGSPGILGLEPLDVPGSWQVTVTLPQVEQVLARVYSLAFQAGVETVRAMAGLPRTAATTTGVQAAVAVQVIEPLRSLVPAGESAMSVLRAAHVADIPFVHLGNDVHLLGWGRRGRLIDRSATSCDSALGARVTRNKHLTAAILRQAGLPVPVHEIATQAAEAHAAAARLGYPVVVKPLDGERGEGVTTGILEAGALEGAMATARRASATGRVLVEREVAGVCHRLFMVAGELLYAVKRWPRSVVGDGHGTIAELVAAAAAREAARPPWRREPPFVLDELAMRTLAAAGRRPDTVPAAGVRVPLRPIESTAWGGDDEDVTTLVHPDTITIARRAAEVVALEVAGVDVMSIDIARPWHETAAVITEVNFAPLLDGHPISRSAIHRYLQLVVEADGRIPVEVFVGGEAAMEAARLRRATLASRHVAALLTSHDVSLDADGRTVPLAVLGVRGRCRALLLDRRAEVIVLVAQTDELASSGLPVDRVTAVHVIDRRIIRHDEPPTPAPEHTIDAVIARVRALHRPNGTEQP